MTNITDIREMKARIIVLGVGGAGWQCRHKHDAAGLQGRRTSLSPIPDAQALHHVEGQRKSSDRGTQVTKAGRRLETEVGRAAAEETINAFPRSFDRRHTWCSLLPAWAAVQAPGPRPILADRA